MSPKRDLPLTIPITAQSPNRRGRVSSLELGAVFPNLAERRSTIASTTFSLPTTRSSSASTETSPTSSRSSTLTILGSESWYEWNKFGLFCYNLSSAAEGGHADFDFLHQRQDGPKTTCKE